LALALLLLDTLLFVSYNFEYKIINIYDGCKTCKGVLQPARVLERYSRYKKLAQAAKVSEDATKNWLIKQTIW